LVKPHIEPILNALLPLSRDPNPRVASSILNSLAELAQVGGEDLKSHLGELMPVIIDSLQDQSSSSKRVAALRALGQVSSYAGFVIEPYTRYPYLLDVLIGILKSEQSPAIRKETMRVMGIIGAIDPYRLQVRFRAEED
ncbi:MAG: armadillo-type protein, partial [Olpidium bornovanus]